ncbi:hypothetical protein [Sphingopyxis sp. YF1]|uniref:hypothetical protein n=1 Tax=Sphingopyxis sp. YF1 TaxID=2482763 RepID=UPI001F60AE51|nr:hypothetical protein [Sphingopyxis sp. YF1]
MKSRNAVFAMWVALFVAIGVVLGATMGAPNSTHGGLGALKPGERRLMVPPREAVEVRLFVKGDTEPKLPRVVELMNDGDGILLTPAQRARLDRSVFRYRMTREEFENDAEAACFIPHHFFRYFDADGAQVAELRVCYCCRGVAMSPGDRSLGDDEEWQFDYAGIEQMLREMNIPVDIDCPGNS